MQQGEKTLIGRRYHAALRRLIRASFSFWERVGIHVTPVHYMHPVPDLRELKPEIWSQHSELVGINMNEEVQLGLLAQFTADYKQEYSQFPRKKTPVAHQYYVNNGLFESVDGEILYCMVRYFKPARIIEIGSGFSTYAAAQALLMNEKENGKRGTLIACEPYPNKTLEAGFPGLAGLIRQRVEHVPMSQFTTLGKNDILFIDSSHVIRIGGDVQHEFLEILPRLQPGVVIHVHDIFLPAEYKRELVVCEHRFYTEQYLLQAFLAFNNSFRVLWASSYMHLRHPDKLEAGFASYDRFRRWPGSFWMQRVQ
ncbi:MAG TPA: class I SAM-dependent methyltransferase [Candidatus Angelobacter sp.]|jgi:predicted O-methyltransferase YrrM|nr:class I SAM-dependent methyltransferase [Candidatus Angelobacter sp.]